MAVYKGDTQEEIDATDAYNMALQTLAESSVPLAAGGDFASTIRKNWPVGQMKFADGGYARDGYQSRGRVKPSAGATAAIEDAVALAKKLYEDAINAALQKYEHVGLRTVEEPITGKPANSRVWENDAPTQQQLEGVSATDANSSKVFNQHGLAEKDWSTGYYPGDYTYVLGSNSAELGVDAGEKILRDPVVLFGGRRDALNVPQVPVRAPDPYVKGVNDPKPELQQAIKDFYAGKLTREDYDNIVRRVSPVEPYDFIPQPSLEHLAVDALNAAKKDKYGMNRDIYQEGDPVSLRLDIPAYTNLPNSQWVNSIHDTQGVHPTTYDSVSAARNVDFVVPENKARMTGEGGPKAPYAVMRGEYVPITAEEAVAQAQEIMGGPLPSQWQQVGMDPRRHSYFYTRDERMMPVTNADEVLQIGPVVYAKNPKVGDREDFGYARGGYAEGGDPEIDEALRLAMDGVNPAEFAPNRSGPQQPAPTNPTIDASGTGKWGRAFSALTGGRNLQNDVENVSSRLRPYEDYSQSFMDALEHSAQMREMAIAGMRSREPHKMAMGATMIPLAYMNQAFAPITAGVDTMVKTVGRFDPRAEAEANVMGFTLMPTPKVDRAYEIARDVLTAPSQMTARAVHTAEAVPGGGTGHLEDIINRSLPDRQAYTNSVRAALEDPRGHDVINKGVGLDTVPTKDTTGAWQPPTGPLEINPGFAAGSDVPLIYRDGHFAVDPEVEQALRTAATVRGGFTAQFGSPYNAQVLDKAGNNLAIDLPSRIKPDAMKDLIAKYGMDDFATADRGSGANILNWGDRFSNEQAGDITQRLGGNLYARTREATNPNMNYVDLSKEWQAGVGSRQVTERMVNELSKLTPERLVSLDNPELANSAGKLLDVYANEQAQGGQVRPDLMNLLQIVRDSGLKGLQEALGDPAQLLPALTAIGLAPSVYQSATGDR